MATNHATTLIGVLDEFQEALEAQGQNSAFVQNWIYQVRHGRATDARFRTWLENQVAYFGEKDPSYAKFMKSLIF